MIPDAIIMVKSCNVFIYKCLAEITILARNVKPNETIVLYKYHVQAGI